MSCRPEASGWAKLPTQGDGITDNRIAAPAWFSQALNATPEIIDIYRDSRCVKIYRWGDPAGRPLILLHGFGANAHWWDHIGPQLVRDGLQIAAVDLAGHGDSDYCEQYTLSGWASDVAAVCRYLSPLKPLLIGHSAGGRIAWKAAELHGADLLAVVSVDGPLPPQAPQPDVSALRARYSQGHRVYRDRDEIIRRFRPRPDQQVVLPYVLQHIAERSVRPLADGWTWAHDTKIYQRRRNEEIVARPLECPLFMVIAENGRTSFAAASLMRREIPQMAMLTIPEAGHHVMLDQPLALVSVLRLIADLMISSFQGLRTVGPSN